jgi:DNA-binding beta-propeller fold protein YncE
VFVGAVERRTYNGGNLAHFREWTDVLTPIYQNGGVTIFAVNGRFTGAMPVTTIEAIPRLEAAEEAEAPPPPQDAPGRLNQPRGVAVQPDGEIVVCDFSNNRVQTFTKDLGPTRAWGARGEAPGEFKDPCAVAVGPANEIFVADTWNQRVQVFSKTGEYRREWGDAFFGPRGIAVEPTKGGTSARVFVSDTGNGRVARYGPDGQKEVEWGGKGDAPGQFFEPSGLAVDADGKVYVCDNGNGRLQIFTRDGKFVSAFKVPGWESKVYSEPHAAVDPKGTIWVTVPLEREVRNYDASGKLLRTITATSVRGVTFETPMGIAYSAPTNTLVVSDLAGRLVRLPLEK